MNEIPDYRRPPKSPMTAIAQSRNWFLWNINGEPMVYRRKPVWFMAVGSNIREFAGDDFEPMGHMVFTKMPDSVSTIFHSTWVETVTPPIFAKDAP